jgi:predicted nuclease of restriction endonuclease-like (RecB) superfamily
MSELNADNYGQLLGEIKQHIRSAQYEALKAVNQKLIALYWEIGKSIVTRQQGETWGKSVVEQLAKDLQQEFPGISGFSARNIWNMRSFYLSYMSDEKLQPMVAEISWTHNLIIMQKCKLDDLVRLPEENPPIGIILCKSKQRTIVEYALKESNQPIGVSTYQIVSTLPQELKDQLPAPEQIARLLQGME